MSFRPARTQRRHGGSPSTSALELRATTVFRREDGEWKVVHRHGDALAADSREVLGQLTPPPPQPTG